MKVAERQFTTISAGAHRAAVWAGRSRAASIIGERPGEFPYTRGIHRDMYRGKLWTMRQFSGFATPEETNRRYHYLLAAGADRAFGGVRPADADGLRRRPRH